MNEDIVSDGFERITAHVEDHFLLLVIQAFIGRGLHITRSDFEHAIHVIYVQWC